MAGVKLLQRKNVRRSESINTEEKEAHDKHEGGLGCRHRGEER